MRILGLYSEDYPWDVRIEKILGGLAGRGHDIHLVCRNLKRSAGSETNNGLNCRRVLGPDVGFFWQSVLSIPAYFNPVWSRAVRRGITETRPDLVFVRDLPLAPLAIGEARRAGLPCLVDMAENHPEMWRQVCQNDRWKIPSLLMKNPALAKKLEIRVARTADMIFVVVTEMREHLLRLGADPARVKVISNTPDLKAFRGFEDPNEEAADGTTLDLIYTGFVTNRRGLGQVIQALALLKDMKPTPRLHIVGDGDHVSSLAAEAERLGIADQLVLHGWVDHQRLPEYISRCHVGLIPHPKNGHTDHTIPNKIFDYMAAGKPVIVSNADPLERIATDNGCGLVFTDGNARELAEVIRGLNDRERRQVMGHNGRQAVLSRYNWATDFQRVVEAIEQFVPGS